MPYKTGQKKLFLAVKNHRRKQFLFCLSWLVGLHTIEIKPTRFAVRDWCVNCERSARGCANLLYDRVGFILSQRSKTQRATSSVQC